MTLGLKIYKQCMDKKFTFVIIIILWYMGLWQCAQYVLDIAAVLLCVCIC